MESGQGDKMSKLCLGLASLFFIAAISFSGCCAPIGPIGPGCTDFGCSDCSGCGASAQYIANGPIDALRNARRRLVCGSGCGEAYVGEWISTPPDAVDPCCGGQFIGGAAKCRPFCFQPGNLLRGIYGKRTCSGITSSTPCDCGASSCSSGSCGIGASPVVGGHVISGPVVSSGCTSCVANAHRVQQTTTRIVTNRPAVDRATAGQVAETQSQVRVSKPAQNKVR